MGIYWDFKERKSGYYLSTTQEDKRDKVENNISLIFMISMDNDLIKNANSIIIHNSIGLYATNYIVEKLSGNVFIARFMTKEELLDNDFKIYFNEIIGEKTDEISLNQKVIHKVTFKVPKLEIKGEKDCCNICLENPKEKYVTQCGHLFCMECIFLYLDHNKLLQEENEHCKKLCKHSRKPKMEIVTCPLCKQGIIF